MFFRNNKLNYYKHEQKLIDFKQKILEEPLSKTDKYWLEQVDFRTNHENELNLFVNSDFVKSSIEKRLYKKIKSVYKDVSGSDDCVFVLDKKLKKEKYIEDPPVGGNQEKIIVEKPLEERFQLMFLFLKIFWLVFLTT